MDETFDFVVIGNGAGSMCAALVLRQAGKSVLILEKTDLAGGSTAKAGGVMWVPNNRFLKADGVEDSIEKATTYLDATVGTFGDAPGTSPERRQTYLREAPQMIEFLISQGIRLRRGPYWPDYYDDRPGGMEWTRTVVPELFDSNELGPWREKLRPNQIKYAAPFGDLLKMPLFKRSWKGRLAIAKWIVRRSLAQVTGRKWVAAGAALQGMMLKAALAQNVDIRLNTPVSEVIIENGVAVGVATTKDGKPWRVGARMGVLINAGGFAWNQEMRDRYIPRTRKEWTHTAPGDTGDMHRELMRIGAAMGQMDAFVGNQMTLPPGMGPIMIQQQIAKPHAFLVDQSAVRYMSECGSYMSFCDGMMKRDETVPAIPSWAIVDSRYLKDYMLGGSMPGTSKPQRWYDENYLRKGNTIEELAVACDLDPATLRKTTDRYNGFVEKGVDEDFHRGERAYDNFLGDYTHKPSATLGKVEEGPFYAIPVVPGDVGTFGGAVTDVHARVLREDGSVIPGLYATGVSTASVMGRCYPGAGCSIGPAFTFGYVAAKHVLSTEAA